jgi:hypothetical protein
MSDSSTAGSRPDSPIVIEAAVDPRTGTSSRNAPEWVSPAADAPPVTTMFTTQPGTKTWKCNKCGQVLNCSRGQNGLYSHAWTCQRERAEELSIRRPGRSSGASKEPGAAAAQGVTRTMDSYMSSDTYNCLVRLFITAALPDKILDNPDMKHILSAALRTNSLPTRRTLPRIIAKAANASRTVLFQTLSKLECVSLCIDTWKSRAGYKYLGATIHYCQDERVVTSAVLFFEQIPVREDALTVAFVIAWKMIQWGISRKVVAITSDNASVMRSAVDHLSSWFKSPIPNLPIVRIPCVCHLLQLTISDVCRREGYKKLLSKCQDMAIAFQRQSLRHALKNATKVPPSKGISAIPCFNETRWNGAFRMVECILKYYESIDTCLQNSDIPGLYLRLRLCREERDQLEDFLKMGEVVARMTISLEGRNSGDIAHFADLSSTLRIRLQDSRCSEDLASQIVDGFKKRLRKYALDIEKTSHFLTLASLLHPSRKEETTRQSYGLCEELLTKYTEYPSPVAARSAAASTSPANASPRMSDSSFFSRPRTTHQQSHSNVWASVSDIFSSIPKQPRTENEVSEFLREPVGDEWWKVLASKYPKMHRLARALFCCLPSSASCERSFSAAGRLVTDRRTKLGHHRIDDSMFCMSAIERNAFCVDWKGDPNMCFAEVDIRHQYPMFVPIRDGHDLARQTLDMAVNDRSKAWNLTECLLSLDTSIRRISRQPSMLSQFYFGNVQEIQHRHQQQKKDKESRESAPWIHDSVKDLRSEEGDPIPPEVLDGWSSCDEIANFHDEPESEASDDSDDVDFEL